MTTPIDSSALPPEVRAAGADGRKLYEAALGFESMLMSQLSSGLADSVDGSGGSDSDSDSDDGGTDASTSMTQQLLPDALAQSVTGGGGTGLALELYRALRGPAK